MHTSDIGWEGKSSLFLCVCACPWVVEGQKVLLSAELPFVLDFFFFFWRKGGFSLYMYLCCTLIRCGTHFVMEILEKKNWGIGL